MDKLEEAARKAKEAAKSVADVLDTSNAKSICTLLSVAFDTALRELEIQLRREELLEQVTKLTLQVERLKADNDRLRGSRARG